MDSFIYGEIVLQSENKQNRYRLFVTEDGRLAAVRLFHDAKDGGWKPKGSDHKVLANIDASGKAWSS
jgi:hypothetical protein